MASSFHLGLSLILIININIEFFSVALIVGTTRYSHSNPVVARIELFGGPFWPAGCQLIIANLETVRATIVLKVNGVGRVRSR